VAGSSAIVWVASPQEPYDVDIVSPLDGGKVDVTGTLTGIANPVDVNQPLDVSAATVPVSSPAPLDVSASSVPVFSAVPMDVSAAPVTVTRGGEWSVVLYPHHEAHDGNRWFHEESVNLDNTDERELLLKPEDMTTDDLEAHTVMFLSATGPITIEAFKGPTITLDGTQIAFDVNDGIFNRKFSEGAPEMDVYHTPTIAADGKRFLHEELGTAGQGNNPATGGSTDRVEIILIAKTAAHNVLLRVTANDDDVDVSILIDWYEHQG
jgi:hypothetical protein